MRCHTRNSKASTRSFASIISAVVPAGVGHDRLTTDFVKRDVLGGVAGGSGNADGAEQLIRIVRRPLQNLHSPHGSADGGEQALDSKGVDQHGLRADHVGDGDDREFQPIGFSGFGVDGGGTGGAHTTADNIGADDEVPLRVQRPTGPDVEVPPTRLSRDRVGGGQMLIACQRMTDQHSVGPGVIQPTIGLVGDFQRQEDRARIEPQGLVRRKAPGPAARLDPACCGRLRRHAALDRLAPPLSMGCSPLHLGYESLNRERPWID